MQNSLNKIDKCRNVKIIIFLDFYEFGSKSKWIKKFFLHELIDKWMKFNNF